MPTPDQLKRLQRETQALVKKLRASGKSDKDIKVAKSKLKSSILGTGRNRAHTDGKAIGGFDRSKFYNKNKEPTEAQKKAEVREELGRKHDIVIIPIFYKRNQEEKEKVVAACAELKAKLMANKLNAWIDQRTKYTPGQKYAYWEHLGVKLRAEMGPKELEKGEIIISSCSTPGEVAKRWTVPNRGNLKVLLQRLHNCGLKWLNVPDSDDMDHQDSFEKNVKKFRQPESEETAEKAETPEADSSPKASAPQVPVGGDSLEVNYVIEDTSSKKGKRSSHGGSGGGKRRRM